MNDGTDAIEISDDDNALARRVAHETGIEQEQVTQVLSLIRAGYSGPIPPASEVARLNDIESGLGTRLVEDHLLQRQHDRVCDNETLKIAAQDSSRNDRWLTYSTRGQWFGLISSFIFLAAAVTALWLGHPAVAAVFISPAIVGAISQLFSARLEPASEKSSDKD